MNGQENKEDATNKQQDGGHVDAALRDAKDADLKFDKDRQRADQAEASLRRTSSEKRQLEDALRQSQEQYNDLQRQLEELKAVKGAESEADELIADIDPENSTLEDYAGALKKMGTMVRGLNKKLAEVKTMAERNVSESKAERQQRKEEAAKNETFNRICTRLEKKHGPGLRNRATELFQQRVEAEGRPDGPAEATLLLDECFASAKDETKKPADKKQKDTVPTDTGGGTYRSPSDRSRVKKGSLDEVASQFEAMASP